MIITQLSMFILLISFFLTQSTFSNLLDSGKYDFTVIIAIYNTARYLREAVESLLHQTIGFREHIEVILVNDGSTDNSEIICLEYVQLYPENIRYIRQPHLGVSAARNLGLFYSRGTFINFLDSDDRWACNSFLLVKEFLLEHQDVSIISCRVRFFEGSDEYAPYDYKFRKTGIISLFEQYNYIQLYTHSSFIRSSAIGSQRFDERLERGEDAHFMNTLLLDHPHYAVIREAEYEYRRRRDGSSADQNNYESKQYFLPFLTHCYQDLFHKSKMLYGKVVSFIQLLFFADYLNRIHQPSFKYLSDNEYELYHNKLDRLLKEVNDSLIYGHKFCNQEKRFVLLSKRKNTFSDNYLISNNCLLNEQICLLSLLELKHCLTISRIKMNGMYLEFILPDYLSFIPKTSISYTIKSLWKVIPAQFLDMKRLAIILNKQDRFFNTGRAIIFQIELFYIFMPLHFSVSINHRLVPLSTPSRLIFRLFKTFLFTNVFLFFRLTRRIPRMKGRFCGTNFFA